MSQNVKVFILSSLLPDGPVEKKISLLLPEMFVAGSARASVSVLGQSLISQRLCPMAKNMNILAGRNPGLIFPPLLPQVT